MARGYTRSQEHHQWLRTNVFAPVKRFRARPKPTLSHHPFVATSQLALSLGSKPITSREKLRHNGHTIIFISLVDIQCDKSKTWLAHSLGYRVL